MTIDPTDSQNLANSSLKEIENFSDDSYQYEFYLYIIFMKVFHEREFFLD